MTENFGLKETDLQKIIDALSVQPAIEEAWIFGSRAKGNYKTGSDVDIALKGKQLDFETVIRVADYLNEHTTMPYQFDLLNYHTIKNTNLTAHIDSVGICFYSLTAMGS